jgi:PAS domain S-box-containing protein
MSLLNLLTRTANFLPRHTFAPLRKRMVMLLLLIGLGATLILCVLDYFGNMTQCQDLIRRMPQLSAEIHQFAVEDAIRGTMTQLLVALIMVLAASQFFHTRVTKRLEYIIEAVLRRVGNGPGNYVRLTEDDELGRLGQTLNRLFDSLEMQESEQYKVGLVAEKTDQGVIICDQSGRIEWVNASYTHLTGYALAECYGRKPSELLQGPLTDKDTLRTMRDALQRGKSFHVEVLNYRKSGETYWVALEVQPVHDIDGEVVNYVGLCSDITRVKLQQQKYDELMRSVLDTRAQIEEQTMVLQLRNDELNEARKKAVQAMRYKSDFLANMSHEIRTPMTSILGYSSILLEGLRDDPNLSGAAQTIQRNGEYLLELINDILDLSKIEAGALRVEALPCCPTHIVNDVVNLMQVRADSRQLTLRVQYEGSLPNQFQTDPTRLRQILVNLMGNAIKFTEHGEVRLVVRGVPGETSYLNFEVHDTGIGMTGEQLGRLFQPFTQADGSTTRKFGGTGLGLSISKRLSELLGGTLTVCSAPGKGSVFTLSIKSGTFDPSAWQTPASLPAVIEKPVKKNQSADAAHETKLPYRILLAEDGPDNQRLINYFLTRAGATVTLADNGWIALNVVREGIARGEQFDCVLMDVQMPVMDGYQATMELRRERYAGPIIALTANAMTHDRQLCLDAGCDDYATKPIDRVKLLELVERHVQRMRQQRAAAELQHSS